MEDERPICTTELEKRDSQESRVTSTPLSERPEVHIASPTASSISDRFGSMNLSFASRNSTPDLGVFANNSEVAESDVEEFRHLDYEEFLNGINKINWTGYWRSLKPHKQHGLYFMLMQDHKNIESIASDVISNYTRSPRETLRSVLKLFIDISGYQEFTLDADYDFTNEKSPAEAIKKLVASLPVPNIEKNRKFLFGKIASGRNHVYEVVIYCFLEKMFLAANKNNVLYDALFAGHIFEFIRCMAFNYLISLKATGIIIGVKCLTTMLKLYRHEDIKDQHHKDALSQYVDFLYLLYRKTCVIPEERTSIARGKCATEIEIWVKSYPEVFAIKRGCILHLMKLVQDDNLFVRTTAMEACDSLLSTPSAALTELLSSRMSVVTRFIEDRFRDVSYPIAVKAMKIFGTILTMYPQLITEEYQRSVVRYMFNKNLELAKAAGQFMVNFFRQQSQEGMAVLLVLVDYVSSSKEWTSRIWCVVEACIDVCPELKNWNLFVYVLLNENVIHESKKHIMVMMNECVRYTLTGKCSRSRKVTEKHGVEKTDPIDHADVIATVLPKLYQVIMELKDLTSTLLIADVMVVVDFRHLQGRSYFKYYERAFYLMTKLFKDTGNKLLLDKFCEVFFNFCQRNPLYHERANEVVQNLMKGCADALKNDLKFLMRDFDRSVLDRLKSNSLKVQALFSKFDLSSYFNFTDLVFAPNSSYIASTKNLIICCKWYLVWSLRKVIGSDDITDQSILDLRGKCRQFLTTCVKMMNPSANRAIALMGFTVLCDFYIDYYSEVKLKRMRKRNILIKIEDANSRNAIMTFVTDHIILDKYKGLNIEERRKHFAKLVDLFNMQVLPFQDLGIVFCYYAEGFPTFGRQMDAIMRGLRVQDPALALLIFGTLTRSYKEICKTHIIVDLQHKSSEQLKTLAKTLSNSKEMKVSGVCSKLLGFSIEFSLAKSEQYAFLYFVGDFVKNLNSSARENIYQTLKDGVKGHSPASKDNVVIMFAQLLKK